MLDLIATKRGPGGGEIGGEILPAVAGVAWVLRRVCCVWVWGKIAQPRRGSGVSGSGSGSWVGGGLRAVSVCACLVMVVMVWGRVACLSWGAMASGRGLYIAPERGEEEGVNEPWERTTTRPRAVKGRRRR